ISRRADLSAPVEELHKRSTDRVCGIAQEALTATLHGARPKGGRVCQCGDGNSATIRFHAAPKCIPKMCGIAGYFSTRAREDLSQALHRMTDAIAHRGPDDEGYFESTTADGRARVGLGHRRLSIIDLTTGHQPLGNADGTVQIVYNGEIYNFESLREELSTCGYVFRTRSDTETIVHAYQEWGPDCVSRLRGMFAFAIWDARHSRLFLARDRFGKKPLFIYAHAGVLLFASEIKALLQFPGVAAQ